MFEQDDARLSQGAKESLWRASTVWRDEGYPQPPPLPVLHELGSHILNILEARRFFTTADHTLMGFCPDTAEVGNVCCLLAGGEVPYVLRPATGNSVEHEDPGVIAFDGQEFKLVGQAYIRGIMDGEVAHVIEKRPIDFVLV